MRFIFIAVLLTLVAGCSTTAPEALTFDNSRTFDKPRDEIWKNLEAYFESSSIPVKTQNKENGILVAVRKLKRASIYADCGSSDIASVSDGTLTVNISLQPLGETKTRATVDVTFTAFRSYAGIAKSRIECFSNGTLEEDILKNLSS